jgi:3-oxoacyl-[acyl-carrier-protein] synthase II
LSFAVVARAAVSALGTSVADLAPSRAGAPARVALGPDAALAAEGLLRPRAGRVASLDAIAPAAAGPDRAARLLATALVDLVGSLDAARPGWRDLRLGLALGTSSGGMTSIEELFRARAGGLSVSPELATRATYFGPVAPALAVAKLDVGDFRVRTHILSACAASTFAVGVAARWLARDAVDLVIAGGYDALALLVAAGFEAIRATTAGAPRPFRLGRDGMSLGEGAGLVALARGTTERATFYVHGFGAATDAVHVTAPDRTGDGLARAAERALADAGASGSDVLLVSAHATATPFNDAMEARAIHRVASGDPVVQPLKAQIGHTLGAAGILELLAATASLEAGLLPPAAGEGAVDDDARVRLLDRAVPIDPAGSIPGRPRDPLVLKLSAAFGGANAALVVGRTPRATPGRALRRVALGPRARVVGPDAARAALDAAGVPMAARSKLDSLSLLACGAAAMVVAQLGARGATLGTLGSVGSVGAAGVVVGHSLATLEVDERFFGRLLARGGAQGEPRLFPATSPNVSAGHAAILFGLRGPNAAVSGGLDGGVEALAFAAELVAAGDADGVVVIAVDEIGPVGEAVLAAAFPGCIPPPSGAVAVWLSAGPDGVEVPLDLRPDHGGRHIGHVSLDALLDTLQTDRETR